MSPLFRDPHPTCTRCRGRSCSYKSTCQTCDGWSLGQWEHYRLKRAYAGRSKSSSRHAGDHIETASNPPLSPASTRSVLPAPPSLPFPPPAEGLGEGREALSVMDIKQPRVSSPPSMPMPEHEERGRDTPQVRGEEGDASSTSFASARGGSTQSQPDTLDDKSPPSPSHFRLKISSYHHVDDWGEEGEDRVPSPAPSLPKAKRRREEREQGMDCSRAPDFKKKSTRHRSPTRERPQPRGHDRYAAPAACGLPRCGHCLQGTHTFIGASYALIMIRRSSARTALARGARRSTPSWQRTV